MPTKEKTETTQTTETETSKRQTPIERIVEGPEKTQKETTTTTRETEEGA